jgi:UrcA family protein
MNKIVIITAALLAAPLAAPAEAQSQRTQVVSHADLDLSRERDVRRLDRRISIAVKQVCGAASDADLEGKNEVRRCRTLTSERFSAERGRAIASAAQPTQVASASDR